MSKLGEDAANLFAREDGKFFKRPKIFKPNIIEILGEVIFL
jgi:hypothetical protein